MLFIRFDFNNLDPERIESNRAYRKTGELTINEFANARRGEVQCNEERKSITSIGRRRYQPWMPQLPQLGAEAISLRPRFITNRCRSY